jgi:hypothetical protein
MENVPKYAKNIIYKNTAYVCADVDNDKNRQHTNFSQIIANHILLYNKLKTGLFLYHNFVASKIEVVLGFSYIPIDRTAFSILKFYSA